MSLNPDLIRARCVEIDSSLVRLEEFRRLSREQFLSSQDALDVACYRLLIAIESALALCFHVSAKRLHQVPEEYAGCFVALEQAGLIPETSHAVYSRWRDSGICSCMCTGRLITGRCMTSLRHASTIFVRSVQPSPDWFNGSRPISANTTDSLCFR